ncbi:hypothetical protein ES288_A11G269300v1, partial [Gossypium darwinii]
NYHIALFQLSSRVRDKRTRTVEVFHKRLTIDNNSSPEHSLQLSLYCALQRATLLKISKGTTESFPSPDSLVLRMLVLRTSDCPSPTLIAQPESRQLMRSTY